MKYVDFNFTQFIKGSLLVHCATKEDSDDFLDFCDAYEINVLIGGIKIDKDSCYRRYKENTLYIYSYIDGKLAIVDFNKNKNYSEICRWDANKPVKLVSTVSSSARSIEKIKFDSIIKNILPGQQFQNEHHIIVCDQNGIHFHDRCTRGLVDINFDDEFVEVTYAVEFSEAIKQLHQGKTIVSLVSNNQYKLDEQGKLLILESDSWIQYNYFDIDDINGKWIVR